jgi:hypothetical protein
MSDLVLTVRQALVWSVVPISIGAGIVAIRLLGRPPRSQRPDVETAARAARWLSFVSVLFLSCGIAGLPSVSGRRPDWVAGVLFGAGGGLLLYCSMLAGYALMARPTVGRWALAGLVVGPFLCLWLPLVLAGVGSGD